MATTPARDVRSVAVVHGRDLAARDALFQFLSAIDLHPIEFEEAIHRTGDAAAYVGHAVEKLFEQSQAVIVLLTCDEQVTLREELRDPKQPDEAKPGFQSRPNVFFEAGMALALHPKQTVFVQLGPHHRPFSDLAGRHVLHFSGTEKDRNQLAERLRVAGCAVNTTASRWLSAGDFAGALGSFRRSL